MLLRTVHHILPQQVLVSLPQKMLICTIISYRDNDSKQIRKATFSLRCGSLWCLCSICSPCSLVESWVTSSAEERWENRELQSSYSVRSLAYVNIFLTLDSQCVTHTSKVSFQRPFTWSYPRCCSQSLPLPHGALESVSISFVLNKK